MGSDPNFIIIFYYRKKNNYGVRGPGSTDLYFTSELDPIHFYNRKKNN